MAPSRKQPLPMLRRGVMPHGRCQVACMKSRRHVPTCPRVRLQNQCGGGMRHAERGCEVAMRRKTADV
eukprot:6214291-Pleurochrysis_carterae.AAC.1